MSSKQVCLVLWDERKYTEWASFTDISGEITRGGHCKITFAQHTGMGVFLPRKEYFLISYESIWGAWPSHLWASSLPWHWEGPILHLTLCCPHRETHWGETWEINFSLSKGSIHTSGPRENHSEHYQLSGIFCFLSFWLPINTAYFIKLSALLSCQEF